MKENLIFVVNEEPYCIWENNIHQKNSQFLNGIDSNYFSYLLEVHLKSKDEQRSSLALRISLHHALETMFSLLGAYIQAPNCAYAWIAKCSNSDLRQLISKVSAADNNLYTPFQSINSVTWENIAELIYTPISDNQEYNVNLPKNFASLWKKLAAEFLDVNHIDEYNSIKHGFRVASGGFSLKAAIQNNVESIASNDEMSLVSESQNGTSYLKISTLGTERKNRSIRSEMLSIGWNKEKVTSMLQLVSISIVNIVSSLKYVNNLYTDEDKFLLPKTEEDFNKPWSIPTGMLGMKLSETFTAQDFKETTKEELLKKLNL